MKDHLSTRQRSYIRYSMRATEEGVARKYGISVAQVRAVRAGAQLDHPVRLAAKERRLNRMLAAEGVAITRHVIPAALTPPPRGQGKG